ncbi:GreA/GreB family elongation factor [Klebsiella pneumoniae]
MGLDDSVNVSVYSPQSPLGGAILGHSKGESTEYQAPNGKTIKVTILNVEPFEE